MVFSKQHQEKDRQDNSTVDQDQALFLCQSKHYLPTVPMSLYTNWHVFTFLVGRSYLSTDVEYFVIIHLVLKLLFFWANP